MKFFIYFRCLENASTPLSSLPSVLRTRGSTAVNTAAIRIGGRRRASVRKYVYPHVNTDILHTCIHTHTYVNYVIVFFTGARVFTPKKSYIYILQVTFCVEFFIIYNVNLQLSSE